MRQVTGIPRQQQVLFPESLDQYISADNPVRFIDAFVDSPDLAAAGFTHTIPAPTPPLVPGERQRHEEPIRHPYCTATPSARMSRIAAQCLRQKLSITVACLAGRHIEPYTPQPPPALTWWQSVQCQPDSHCR